MTLDPHPAPGERRGRPSQGVTGQYSKALLADDSGLSLLPAVSAMLAAPDADGAARECLAALADARGLGYRRALLLRVDAAGRRLTGWDAAGSDTEELRDALLRLRVPLAAGDEHPLVRLLATGGEPQDLEGAGLPGVLSRLARAGRLRALALGTREEPLGLLLLQERAEAGAPARRDAAAALLARLLGRIAAEEGERARSAADDGALATVAETIRTLLHLTNLPDILVLCARAALRLAQARGVLIWTLEETSGDLLLAVHLPAERKDSLEPWLRELARPAAACAGSGALRQYADLRQADEADLTSLPEPREAVFLPLRAFGDLLGVLAVLREPRGEAGATPFGDREEAALVAIAGYAAVAAKNAALADRAREALSQMRESQAAQLRLQRWAAVGESAGEIGLELRNPIIAIVGLARTLERELPEGDTQREYARVILREARRIEARLEAQRALLGPVAPQLALQSLNGLLRAELDELREETERRGVLVEELYADPLPELLLDGERVRQALGNILRHGIEQLQEGDTLRVETLRQGDFTLVEIAHTGARLAGEVLTQLFVPFQAAQPGGAGLGLATAYEIVKQHGGEVSVRRAGDWAAIYTLSFPCDQNLERRRQADRRRRRDRRGQASGDGTGT